MEKFPRVLHCIALRIAFIMNMIATCFSKAANVLSSCRGRHYFCGGLFSLISYAEVDHLQNILISQLALSVGVETLEPSSGRKMPEVNV